MIRGIWTCLVVAVITPVAALVSLAALAFRPRGNTTLRVARIWSRVLLATVGARAEFHGVEHATERMPCVYMANHTSNVDIWVLISVLPTSVRFVAKESLFRVPLMGWAMAAAGFVPVDRANRTRAIQSLRVAARRIRDGHPLVLFPEGTRSTGGLRPFKKGPFHLALDAGVPVVPISIRGSREVLPRRSLHATPGPVRVRLFPPVDVGPYLPDDVPGLMARVRADIQCGLDDAAQEPRKADRT